MTAGSGRGQSRWVLHVDMDAFFASCEQLTRPTLRGKPVLVGGIGGRGVVAGCSYEARAFGAHSAMPMHQARRTVGVTAVVLPPRFAVYSAASARVLEVLRAHVDVVEQVSIDEAFLEPPALRGATPEECRRWSDDLREAIREATGLPASVGAGAGKQYAKIASGLAKPDGVHVIPRVDHASALEPLPVRRLWGIGPVAGAALSQAGIETIGDLAATEDREVERILGKALGRSILLIARGVDDHEVAERGESKQISAESTFATDLRTSAEVAAAVRRSAGHVHRRLLRDGRYARTVTVKVKRADFHSVTRSATLDHGTTQLRTITETALGLVPDPVTFGAVRLVGVGVSGLVSEFQGLLFGEEEPDAVGDYDAAGPAEPEGGDPGESAGDVIPGTRHESPSEDLRAGADVRHRERGFGWVQGSGHGRVTVRFETRTTGPGRTGTFAVDDPDLSPADPVESLDW